MNVFLILFYGQITVTVLIWLNGGYSKSRPIWLKGIGQYRTHGLEVLAVHKMEFSA